MGLLDKLFGGSSKPKPPAPAPAEPAKAPEPPAQEIRWPELTPEQCRQRIEAGGVVVLDVRTRHEHENRRIPGSVLMPVQVLASRFEELDPQAEYIVHCEHGMRSTDASYFLVMKGFARVSEMAGGLSMYQGPTERGPVKPASA